jgi:hypothetical protein
LTSGYYQPDPTHGPNPRKSPGPNGALITGQRFRSDLDTGNQFVQWAESPAFRINATAVPEPAAIWLASAGLALIATRRKGNTENKKARK